MAFRMEREPLVLFFFSLIVRFVSAARQGPGSDFVACLEWMRCAISTCALRGF